MKKKAEPKLMKQTHDNNYGERNPLLSVPSNRCMYCICEACTGFMCPWVPEHQRTDTDGNQFSSRRCHICLNRNFKKIVDCDFYTSYKRQKFYLPKKYLRQKTRFDELSEKLDLILNLLDKNKSP